jgi:hypothetical protein
MSSGGVLFEINLNGHPRPLPACPATAYRESSRGDRPRLTIVFLQIHYATLKL